MQVVGWSTHQSSDTSAAYPSQRRGGWGMEAQVLVRPWRSSIRLGGAQDWMRAPDCGEDALVELELASHGRGEGAAPMVSPRWWSMDWMLLKVARKCWIGKLWMGCYWQEWTREDPTLRLSFPRLCTLGLMPTKKLGSPRSLGWGLSWEWKLIKGSKSHLGRSLAQDLAALGREVLVGHGHVLLPDVDGLLQQVGGRLQSKKILPKLSRHILTSRSSSVTPEEGDEGRVEEEGGVRVHLWSVPRICSPAGTVEESPQGPPHSAKAMSTLHNLQTLWFLLRPQRGESQRTNCRRPGSSSSAPRTLSSPSPSLARSGRLEPEKILWFSPHRYPDHLIWRRESRVPMRILLVFRGIFLTTDVRREKADTSHPELNSTNWI